jgi:hypothetical protein
MKSQSHYTDTNFIADEGDPDSGNVQTGLADGFGAMLSDSLYFLFPKYKINNMNFSFNLGIKMHIKFDINLHTRALLQ